MKKLLVVLALMFVGIASATTINLSWIVDGNNYAQTTCESGGNLNIPSTTPTKRGYHFIGWDLSDYTQLEYIESTGTQYIDTGFKPNQDTKVEVDFEFSTSLASNAVFFGSSAGWADASFGFYIGSSANVWSNYNSDIDIDSVFSPVLNARYLYTHDKRNIYVGGVLKYTHSATTFQSTGNIFLGRVEGKAAYSFKGKYYSVKIWDNGALVRNLIPAKNSSNVVGMYDTVSGQFFTNQGTGDFIAGPVSANQTL